MPRGYDRTSYLACRDVVTGLQPPACCGRVVRAPASHLKQCAGRPG